MTTKRILTHLFVVFVNFYMLAIFTGLLLSLETIFFGPINFWVIVLIPFLAFMICTIYEFTRHKWNISTIGERMISNTSKIDILEQTKLFSISRIPLFILIVITLSLNSNLTDALAEGKVFSMTTFLFHGIIFTSIYLGLINFFARPAMLPVFLIAGGLLLTAFGFMYSPNARITGGFMFKFEIGLAAIWIITGFIYKDKAN